jgi:ABC-type antimicrobial peptide transport system permease subunit
MKKFILYRNIFVSLVSISIGVVMLYVNIAEENGGVPFKRELEAISGSVAWVEKSRYGVKFQLKGSDIFLNYQSKLGGMSNIFRTLNNLNEKPLAILFKRTIPRKDFTGDVYHNVWEIRTEAEVIRSYEKSEEEWRSDELWLFVIIPLFLFGGAHIGWKAMRQM